MPGSRSILRRVFIQPTAMPSRLADLETDGDEARRDIDDQHRALVRDRSRARATKYRIAGSVAMVFGILTVVRLAGEHPIATLIGLSAMLCGVVAIALARWLQSHSHSEYEYLNSEQLSVVARGIVLWGVLAGAMSLYYSL